MRYFVETKSINHPGVVTSGEDVSIELVKSLEDAGHIVSYMPMPRTEPVICDCRTCKQVVKFVIPNTEFQHGQV
jgi:hypothetical protein